MNSIDDESQDELTREYRRDSAGQAGRPSAATRAAVLAEARAAALRRAPAANDSRMWWRAAASLAVVGFAVLLWRQVDRIGKPAIQVAEEAQLIKAEVPPAVAGAAADVALDAPVNLQPPVAPVPAASARAAHESAGGAASAGDRREHEAASQAFEAPSLPRPQATESAPSTLALPDASQRAEARRESTANSKALGSSTRSNDAIQILQQQFPTEYVSSAPPRGLWVLQNAAGEVLRSGRLSDTEGFTAVTLKLEREFPGQNIGPWSVTSVRNAQGVALQLGIAPVHQDQR